MLYNIALVSAIQQHESATSVHMFPPYWTSLSPPTLSHPSRLSQSNRFELPESYSKFPLDVYFTNGNVYVSRVLSQFIPPSPSPPGSTSLFSMSASPLLPCRQVHQYHLSRLHIYALIYNICFSLSDLIFLEFGMK